MLVRALAVAAVLAVSGLAPARSGAADPGLAVQDLSEVSAQAMANSLPGGATAHNVSYSGAIAASGSFTGGDGILGIDQGVVLTTGAAANVVGPNTSTSASLAHGEGGDDDLAAITGRPTKDAAVLEFNIVPESDTLVLRYVFASEEYLENVDHQRRNFIDVMAIWVNEENCATVDGTHVSIETVNPGAGSASFIDNTDGHLDTEMDGLTTVLECQAPVTPGETNHVKVAVADGTNDEGDAAVFIQGEAIEPEPEEPEGADLSVTKADEPDPVISNGIVRYLVMVANAGPDAAAGVAVTDTPSSGEITSASGSGWSCTHTAGQATCALPGGLAAGATAAPIEVLVRAPATAEPSSITNTAMVTSADDPNTANDTAQEPTEVAAFDSNSASTYCPPEGCTYGTTRQVTRQDNTGNKVLAGAGGGGSVSTLHEGDTTFRCRRHRNLGNDRFGQETDFLPPAGYEDPANPIKVVTTYHRSTVKKKARVRICMRKPNPSDPTKVRKLTVRPCKVRGIAKPHPCINRIRRMKNGNLRVIMLMLSPDPQWRR